MSCDEVRPSVFVFRTGFRAEEAGQRWGRTGVEGTFVRRNPPRLECALAHERITENK